MDQAVGAWLYSRLVFKQAKHVAAGFTVAGVFLRGEKAPCNSASILCKTSFRLANVKQSL